MGTLCLRFTNHRRAAHNGRQQELRAQRAPDPMGPDRTCRTCGTRWICGTRRAYGARWTRGTRWAYGTRWTRRTRGTCGTRRASRPGRTGGPEIAFAAETTKSWLVLFARAARPTERSARLPAPQQRGYVYVGDLCSNMRTRRRKPPLDVIVRQVT
jgi:hypothetical protein